MTTETLNFPVFHSEQGVETDDVRFFMDGSIREVDKATDLQLAKSASHNDMGAFEEIYKRHHRRVYSICLRMLQNASEAEDLMVMRDPVIAPGSQWLLYDVNTPMPASAWVIAASGRIEDERVESGGISFTMESGNARFSGFNTSNKAFSARY